MKKLAGWAALLAAPTLLTSWYGMNFHHMPELDKPWAYPAIIAVMGWHRRRHLYRAETREVAVI